MMDSNNTRVNGYILAGGLSSRMGEDKGLLLVKDKAMITYVIEQMKPLFDNLVIVSNNPTYQKFGLEVIPDVIKNIGPAGGIYTALTHSDANMNFIVSCDMPFITKNAIDFMIKNSHYSPIVLAENQGKVEPLFGLYSKDCTEIWLQLIQQKSINCRK